MPSTVGLMTSQKYPVTGPFTTWSIFGKPHSTPSAFVFRRFAGVTLDAVRQGKREDEEEERKNNPFAEQEEEKIEGRAERVASWENAVYHCDQI